MSDAGARRRAPWLGLLCAACAPSSLLESLTAPSGARTLVYAEQPVGGVLTVTAHALDREPAPVVEDREGAIDAAALFYAQELALLELPEGPIAAATEPPLRSLAPPTLGGFELTVRDAASEGWRETPSGALPGLVADFRFANAGCHAYALGTKLLELRDLRGMVALDAARVLVVSATTTPSEQLHVVTATGASALPGRAFAQVPYDPVWIEGELHLTTWTASIATVWRGDFDAGLEPIASSTETLDRVNGLGVLPGTRRLVGRTRRSAVFEITEGRWRQLHRGLPSPTQGARSDLVPYRDALLMGGGAGNGVQVVLAVTREGVNVEPLPVPRSISGLGSAGGEAWLGLSIGGVFRRDGAGWENLEVPNLNGVNAFLGLAEGVVLIGSDRAELLEWSRAYGYCVPSRVHETRGIARLVRAGDTIFAALTREDEPDEIWTIVVR